MYRERKSECERMKVKERECVNGNYIVPLPSFRNCSETCSRFVSRLNVIQISTAYQNCVQPIVYLYKSVGLETTQDDKKDIFR